MVPYRCTGCLKVETQDPPKTVMPRVICGNAAWTPVICDDCKRDLEGRLQTTYWGWLRDRSSLTNKA